MSLLGDLFGSEGLGGALGVGQPTAGGGKSTWGSVAAPFISPIVQGILTNMVLSGQNKAQKQNTQQNNAFIASEKALDREAARENLLAQLAASAGGAGSAASSAARGQDLQHATNTAQIGVQGTQLKQNALSTLLRALGARV